jgi:hypothetical protein
MPEGTNPFICTYEGCDRSFKTGSKLRTHAKTHDGKHIFPYQFGQVYLLSFPYAESRYTCMHPSHTTDAAAPPKFANWSALQAHNKSEHPPACHQPGCEGKTFANNKALKKHCIKMHLDGVPEREQQENSSETEGQSDESREEQTDSSGRQVSYLGAFEEPYIGSVQQMPPILVPSGSSYEDLIDPQLL